MRRSRSVDLTPLDPEIERTLRQLRAAQRATEPMAEQEIDERDRAMNLFEAPMLGSLNPSIVAPDILANNFELKPVMFHMLQTVGQYSGTVSEDPHLHLKSFVEVSDSFKMPGVNTETLRLKLFSYSLRDQAKVWLNSLPPGSITTWNILAEKFLMKYFPPTKTATLRKDINTFRQIEGETLHETWERFKQLLKRCPAHGIPYWIQLQTFYNGLSESTRSMVDATAGGALMTKSYNEAYAILERMAINSCLWPSDRVVAAKATGKFELDSMSAVNAQLAMLAKKIDNLSVNTAGVNAVQTQTDSCVFCGEGHLYEMCPTNPDSVCYVGNYRNNNQQYSNNNNNPYSNYYNAGSRNHPNFSWSNNQNVGQSSNSMANKSSMPPGFHDQPRQQQVEKKSVLEDVMAQFITRTEKYMTKTDSELQSHGASLRNLELQVGQLAQAINSRPQGALPSDTENPRQGKEHCKAITLRSGKELEPSRKEPSSAQQDLDVPRPMVTEKEKETAPEASTSAPTPVNRPPPPFPQRFQNQK